MTSNSTHFDSKLLLSMAPLFVFFGLLLNSAMPFSISIFKSMASDSVDAFLCKVVFKDVYIL